MLFTNALERLDQQTTEPTSGSHLTWRGALQPDLHGASFDGTTDTICQQHHFGGNWYDKPSMFSAYTPLGCVRIRSLLTMALTIASTDGHKVSSKSSCCGLSYKPRDKRRSTPSATSRCKALLPNHDYQW